MKDFNAFMFVSHAASDLNGEFTDLENLMEQGGDKAREIGNAFQHLVSLIQGMEYTIDFIEDDEARHEIVEVINEWQETLMGYRAGCMKIIYSKRMGQDFDILTKHEADGTRTYTVSIDGYPRFTGKSLDEVRDYFYETNK